MQEFGIIYYLGDSEHDVSFAINNLLSKHGIELIEQRIWRKTSMAIKIRCASISNALRFIAEMAQSNFTFEIL